MTSGSLPMRRAQIAPERGGEEEAGEQEDEVRREADVEDAEELRAHRLGSGLFGRGLGALGASASGGDADGRRVRCDGAGARAVGADRPRPVRRLARAVNMSMAISPTPATMQMSATLKVGQWSWGYLEKRLYSQRTQSARKSMKSTTCRYWMRSIRLPSAPPEHERQAPLERPLLGRELAVERDDEGDGQDRDAEEEGAADALGLVLEQAPGAARVPREREAQVVVDDSIEWPPTAALSRILAHCLVPRSSASETIETTARWT